MGPVLYLCFIAAILLVMLLGIFGLIGPKRIRDSMRKFHTWWFKDSALFFPIDPYKPLTESLADGVRDFWPTKKRAQKSLEVSMIVVSIAIVGIVVSLL